MIVLNARTEIKGRKELKFYLKKIQYDKSNDGSRQMEKGFIEKVLDIKSFLKEMALTSFTKKLLC